MNRYDLKYTIGMAILISTLLCGIWGLTTLDPPKTTPLKVKCLDATQVFCSWRGYFVRCHDMEYTDGHVERYYGGYYEVGKNYTFQIPVVDRRKDLFTLMVAISGMLLLVGFAMSDEFKKE